MMMQTAFSEATRKWVERVNGAMDAIVKMSAQEFASVMQELLTDMVYEQPVSPSGYIRTGFLRASLVASTKAMPVLNLSNPGGKFTSDAGGVELVIASAEPGETIYLGYTAQYGAYVHYGAGGRPARPWVDRAIQLWPTIVAAQAADLKARLKI